MMSPQPKTEEIRQRQQNDYPTSPWTEAYQAQLTDAARMPQPGDRCQYWYDAETQSPTHDALSEVYNQGY